MILKLLELSLKMELTHMTITEKRGPGRPRLPIATPTAIHSKLLAHFNNDTSVMAEALGVVQPRVLKWFKANDFPLAKLLVLSRITPFTLDELLTLSSKARAA